MLGKKLSIEFCNNIITPEWALFLKEFSKKDDLADCLLQGYSFFVMLIEENNKKLKRDLREQKAKEKKENKPKRIKKNS